MKINPAWLSLLALVAAVFPVVKPYIGLGAPNEFDWLSSMILFGILIICGMLVAGFNAVIERLDGK